MNRKQNKMSNARVHEIRPVDTVTSDLVDVTPAMAETWLGKMPRNRHLSANDVAKHARAMVAGHWKLNGESIKFDVGENIIDGQHRLHAVVSSGKTIQFLIVRGLETEVQDVIDTGRKRSAADALTLNGYPNSNNLAAAARLCIAFQLGDLRSAAQKTIQLYTHTEIREFVEANPDLVEACSAGVNTSLPVRPATASFARFTLRRIDFDQAESFFDDLANMRTTGQGDPRFTLLRRLSTAKQSNEKMSVVAEAHYIFRTWNAMRQGETLGNLKTGNVHGGFDFQVPL